MISRATRVTLLPKPELADVHNHPDGRQIAIDQAGVSNILFPSAVLDRGQGAQYTVARWTMAVSLAHDVKGTHMSRFVEVLNGFEGQLGIHSLPALLGLLKQRLKADSARVEVDFPYFMKRAAPVTGAQAVMDYQCRLLGESGPEDDDFMLCVTVPVASLCPCSKEISDYGAHNQRGYVTLEVRSARSADGTPELMWIEDLIDVAEASASAPVYPLLKRPDERHVTMQAYDNPVFVEDMVRGVAGQLKEDSRVAWFRVHVVNHESIHNHNAFACIEWDRTSRFSNASALQS